MPRKAKEPSSGTRYPARIKLRAKKLYEEGMPVAQICRLPEMSSSPHVVKAWLVQSGVEIREKKPVHPRAALRKALKSGRARKDIAADFGCSMKLLSQLATGKIR